MPDQTTTPKRGAARKSRSARPIMIGAVIVFAGVAIWLANSESPNISLNEALTMAGAIESAKSQAQLEAMLHPAAPRLPQARLDKTAAGIRSDPAEAIWVQREFGTYVFVERHADAQGRPTLVFRSEKDDILRDYQEVRLERHEGQPKIVDLWSMAAGGWLGELQAERARLDNGFPQETVDNLMLAIRSHEPAEKVVAALGRIPEPFRSSRRVGVQFLHTLERSVFATFRRGVEEYRALHRQSLTADLVVLQAAQMELKQKGQADPDLLRDALVALKTIEARIDDKAFLGPWREQLH